ncbi:MAG: hypothetical protein GTO51_10155 [Candidatus Latescibacteria bacterium]|nr:hypothetical protein [Candidatus Latescibacterota bacterium]NIM66331.1 hypothetical protein [Candidatus Latescibacterota bacterium]NIO02810.1 hypothetical protein [Candidatus Latescibacterota bacterium]NIO29945.1 hypothetical protein [Candidatus Latescibacterota bacterium]NIO57560.1 hypothetical protein [Candidatus Latescibacterota bacterium]
MSESNTKSLFHDRPVVIGFLALIPPSFILLLHLLWWAVSPKLFDILTKPLRPIEDTFLEVVIVVGSALVCPLLAVICGAVLISKGRNRSVGYLLVLGGCFFILALMASRPS